MYSSSKHNVVDRASSVASISEPIRGWDGVVEHDIVIEHFTATTKNSDNSTTTQDIDFKLSELRDHIYSKLFPKQELKIPTERRENECE